MLFFLGQYLSQYFGPARLLTSHALLGGVGVILAAFSTWFFLPKLWHLLPTDRGRAFAVNAEQSKGKPVGAGLIFVSIFVLSCFFFVPFDVSIALFMLCMIFAMMVGYKDDESGGFSQAKLAILDAVVSLATAMILCGFDDMVVWFPFIKGQFSVPFWLYIPFASGIIWFSINATNCTDGVDGLSGSLGTVAFLFIGIVLYAVLGFLPTSRYLLVPHYPDGARWALTSFLMAGCLLGYLWHNANPSAVLMGDAGSRPMGLLLGALVMATGNPFLIFIVATVVLINGGTGLFKLAMKRFFRIGIFGNVRFPLHDHFRKNKGWSNTQVLVRFLLIQMMVTPILLLLFFKIR